MPGFTTRRSTTISMLCLMFLSSRISSDSSYMLPSTITRTYPLFFACSKIFSCLPFLPRTTGASSWILLLSGSSMIRSTIWSTLCFSITRPQFGQWGIPIRAYKRRR